MLHLLCSSSVIGLYLSLNEYYHFKSVVQYCCEPLWGQNMGFGASTLGASVNSAAVLVAHPDDETLWAGGLMLSHPETSWFVATLTRAGDTDRAPKFREALARLRAVGTMADLDDGPEQTPLEPGIVEATIARILPPVRFNVLLTHGLAGEYTRHRRHEELARAAVAMWQSGRLLADSLWLFAYDDDGGSRLPQPSADADMHQILSPDTWQRKFDLITGVYGFAPSSWEARATPREEAFWRFDSLEAASRRLFAEERRA
jgi:LmbE family N-acetylglucosaminyl deacetylase